MIQGGDPTGTGTGGESIWGKAFKDELNSKLTHSERGIVSMANSGPHTNGSQFFILYKSAKHLDYKHSVFGRVVGGFETLSKMEKVPTDDDDRPKVSSRIFRGLFYPLNPFETAKRYMKNVVFWGFPLFFPISCLFYFEAFLFKKFLS